jgi:hypothetical protein
MVSAGTDPPPAPDGRWTQDPPAELPPSANSRRQVRAKRRRRWILWGTVFASAVVVLAVVYVVTSPPPLPFHELWSKNLDGNPYGRGVGEGDLYVTYSYGTQDRTNFSGGSGEQTANLEFQILGIDLASGGVAWSSSFVLPDVIDAPAEFSPGLVSSGTDVLLAVSWSSPSGANLTVVTVQATTGQQLAEWSTPIPAWSSMAASQDLETAAGTLVTWLPRSLTSPTPLLLSGFNVTSGRPVWNDSVQIPLTLAGWGTGISSAVQLGDVLEIWVAPAGGPSWLLGIGASNGSVLGQRTFNETVDLSDATATNDEVYFLQGASNALFVAGFNLSSGTNLTPIPVDNVRDASSGSASLFAVDGDLVVASYSPDLSYAAYDPGGRMLWESSFPNATPCAQPNFAGLGPCNTDLGPPMALGTGFVLLSSYASVVVSGDSYVDTFRAVNLGSGVAEWSATYAFTFGYQFWPWQGPEPSVSVQSTDGSDIVYALVTPDSVSIAGGTTS